MLPLPPLPSIRKSSSTSAVFTQAGWGSPVSHPTLPHGTAHLGSAELSFCERNIRSAWRLLMEAISNQAQTPWHWECMNRPVCCTSCMFLGVAEVVATPWTHPFSGAPKCYTWYSCNLLYTCNRNWSPVLHDPVYLSVLTAVTSSCLWNTVLSTYALMYWTPPGNQVSYGLVPGKQVSYSLIIPTRLLVQEST